MLICNDEEEYIKVQNICYESFSLGFLEPPQCLAQPCMLMDLLMYNFRTYLKDDKSCFAVGL